MSRPRAVPLVGALAARRRTLAGVSAGAAAAALALWLVPDPAPPPGARWGVDQLRVRRTAHGHMLDLRYQVVDPTRAGSLLAKRASAYLVHERSGRRLAVPDTPKAGTLRAKGVPEAGRSYFALFSNPGGLVRRGDQVSVVLGDLTARLTVE